MTVILACGGIDLSVGSTMSLAGVVLAVGLAIYHKKAKKA